MDGLDHLRNINKRISSFSGNNADANPCLANLNRTITVRIARDGGITNTYVVFGYNAYGTNRVIGDGDAIVTIPQSSFDNTLRDMASNPFTTMFCRYKTDNELNLSHPINYVKQDSTGLYQLQKIVPINYLETDYRELDGPIYIPDFKGMVFDGSYALTGEIEENSEIIMVLTIQSKVAIGNAALDKNILKVNSDPAPNTIKKVNAIINPYNCK